MLPDLHFANRIDYLTSCALCLFAAFLTFLSCTPTFHWTKGHLFIANLNRTDTLPVLLLNVKIFHFLISVFSRFASGYSCPDDSWHHCVHRRVGCGLYGNEVHHLWREWQTAQVPHCHDRRHHPLSGRWGWKCFFRTNRNLFHHELQIPCVAFTVQVTVKPKSIQPHFSSAWLY